MTGQEFSEHTEEPRRSKPHDEGTDNEKRGRRKPEERRENERRDRKDGRKSQNHKRVATIAQKPFNRK
jgi:hypothetical protein